MERGGSNEPFCPMIAREVVMQAMWKLGVAATVMLLVVLGSAAGYCEDDIELIAPSDFLGWHNTAFTLMLVASYTLTDLSNGCPSGGHSANLEVQHAGPPPQAWGWVEIPLSSPSSGEVSATFCVDHSWEEGVYTAGAVLLGDPVPGGCLQFDHDGPVPVFGLDFTAPEIVINAPCDDEYELDEVVLADYRAADAWSGIDCIAGSVENGEPIDTSTPGAHVFEVSARDKAGNDSIRWVLYHVHEAADPEVAPANPDTAAPSSSSETAVGVFMNTEFDSSDLDSGWFWLREAPSEWGLQERPGTLSIATGNGDMRSSANSSRNVLLREAPSTDYVLETYVLFDPTENYQKAGLIVYADDGNWVSLTLSFCDDYSGQCTGKGVFFDRERAGNGIGHYGRDLENTAAVYLRVEKLDATLTAYYSEFPGEWQYLATYHLGDDGDRFVHVGLITDSGGQSTEPINAYFDYFRIEQP